MSVKNLTDINFPIFPIRQHYRIYNKDGIVYIDTYKKTWKLDNKNLPQKTLAERRLIIKENLYPLTKTIYTIAQMLKSGYTHFIDYYGNIFKYKKTAFTNIYYRKVIKAVENNKTGMVALFVEGKDIEYPFVIGNLLYEQYRYSDIYLGLLKYSNGYILYDISDENKGTKRKKV